MGQRLVVLLASQSVGIGGPIGTEVCFAVVELAVWHATERKKRKRQPKKQKVQKAYTQPPPRPLATHALLAMLEWVAYSTHTNVLP